MMFKLVLNLIAHLLFVRAAVVQETSETQSPLPVVLITGCSSGIGKATALAFHHHGGFIVYATMRSPDRWDSSIHSHNLKIRALDVTSPPSVETLVQDIITVEGRIDIVVNNAGYGIAGCLEMVSVQEAKDVFDVNVWGVVHVLQAVLPYMRRASRGHIINISSTSGIRGIPCLEFYSGSKFALEGIMDSFRYSAAMYNISITNVNAGPVKTEFTTRFGESSVGGKGTRKVDQGEALEAYTDMMIRQLNLRMQSAEVQSANEIGDIVVDVALLKLNSSQLTQVPFNLATSPQSQKVLDGVRVNPTGWGGIYAGILDAVPSLVSLHPQSAGAEEL